MYLYYNAMLLERIALLCVLLEICTQISDNTFCPLAQMLNLRHYLQQKKFQNISGHMYSGLCSICETRIETDQYFAFFSIAKIKT